MSVAASSDCSSSDLEREEKRRGKDTVKAGPGEGTNTVEEDSVEVLEEGLNAVEKERRSFFS